MDETSAHRRQWHDQLLQPWELPWAIPFASGMCHQLPAAAIMCLLWPEVASRLCCSFCIWGILVEP